MINKDNKKTAASTSALALKGLVLPAYEIDDGQLTVGDINRIRKAAEPMLPKGKVIESESTIVLTRRESLRLLELFENPPPMNAKLKKLMADYEKGRADDRDCFSSVELNAKGTAR